VSERVSELQLLGPAEERCHILGYTSTIAGILQGAVCGVLFILVGEPT
jgi:hypothetical protein